MKMIIPIKIKMKMAEYATGNVPDENFAINSCSRFFMLSSSEFKDSCQTGRSKKTVIVAGATTIN